MYYVYILKLDNKKYYIGYTSDLRKRLYKHKTKSTITTKYCKKIKLIFYSAFNSKTKALKFEKYLKSSSGHAFRNKRLI